MPELHINGRIPYHNSSLENNAIGASYDTSSSFMVIRQTLNSTIAFSTTTNTVDTENSFCGIVFSIFCLCLALVIIIWSDYVLSEKDRKRKQERVRNSSSHLKWSSFSLPMPCNIDIEQTPFILSLFYNQDGKISKNILCVCWQRI